jgi:K+/H+ antiporter YhaU regulatory subunit KhtT
MSSSNRRPTPLDRLAYAFDNSLAGGPIVLIGWLAGVSTILILGLAAIVWMTGIAPASEDGTRPGFGTLIWMGLMRTLDSGTVGGDEGSWLFLLAMLAVTFGGIFVVSTLVGALTGVIDEKMTELRKGRSRVLENGHTLILGWSPRVFTIVSELVTANENQQRSTIVILGDMDKVEMEDEIRERIKDTKTTRIVCRSGNPADMNDLEIANVQGSKAIILLPPPGSHPDTETIKILLAITNSPARRQAPYHCVAEIRNPRNLAVAKLVGRDEAALVAVPDLLARMTVQTCRQSGLSMVYQELFDFAGDEIYFKDEPALIGKSFGDSLNLYADSSIMGLLRSDGSLLINPPMHTTIGAGDKIIAISEDDDTLIMTGMAAVIDESAIEATVATRLSRPERTLILGWNLNAPLIVREMGNYVAAGSELSLLAEFPDGIEACQRQCPSTTNLQVRLLEGDTTDRVVLDQLAIPSYDHVILLSPDVDDGRSDDQRADAQTLITLLNLRDIRDQSSRVFSIVSEMRDPRNRALAEVTVADDFIVGDELVSQLLSQISENKDLNRVFDDLLDPEGSEIYLKPASDYILPGREVSFSTVVESARRRGHIAIGYRQQCYSADKEKNYGVATNPHKSSRITFAPNDSVIVLAED